MRTKGFTLLETVIAVTVLALVGTSVYGVFAKITRYSSDLRARSLAATLANEEFEVIRNLPYADVGIQGGIPAGLIPHTQTVIRGGKEFFITTTIRNIDDPFDGTIGGSPNDLSPADNKLVEIQIECLTCNASTTVVFSGRVAPKNLETASTNGALFVQVFDANGLPVEGADVRIVHTKATSSIIIEDVTNVSGMLQIVDAPPGDTAWSIEVSKPGYSSDQTYATSSGNPDPVKRHATVVNQQVTQVSFAIDRTAELTVQSQNAFCGTEGSIGFELSGTKLIGNPSLKKFNESYTTNGSGERAISNLEWDSYELDITGSMYDIAGTNPMLPWNILPDSTQNYSLVVTERDGGSLLALIKDASTGLPISDAEVTLTGPGTDDTQITSQGHVIQTDWSGGAGQADFVTENMFYDSDGNIDTNNPTGTLKLVNNGTYASTGYLTSSVFDLGAPSNFSTLEWQSFDQPAAAGTDSVRFQIASSDTNTATTTWDFVGPSGTAADYYTVTNTDISNHSGKQYIRYRIYLQTADSSVTPEVSDVSLTYASECTPPGQVFFNQLESGSYTLEVTKSGYNTYNESSISVSSESPARKTILLESN